MTERTPGRRVVRFRPHLAVDVVPGEAVYLFAEDTAYAVHGSAVVDLAPFLLGKHTEDEIVTALSADHAPEIVYHALGRLRARGYVVEADASLNPAEVAAWETAGFDGEAVQPLLEALTCEIRTVGEVDAEPLRRALADAGARVVEHDAALLVVLADDYLNPRLEEVNRSALSSGRPWLLARPAGAAVWIGPVFEPGAGGCWECLAFRLRRNRMVETYVEERTGRRYVPAQAATATGTLLAAHLVALRALRWAARGAWTGGGDGAPEPGHGHVEVVRPLTAERVEHPHAHRPQCPSCGDPGTQARRGESPIVLAPSVPAVARDGGMRAVDGKELMTSLERLISPITGVVSGIEEFTTEDPRMPADLLHTCVAGQNFALGATGLDALREGIRSRAAGKGTTALQARVGAACEAIERYSGLYHEDEARITATYRELGDAAVHPNAVAGYSAAQYADRQRWNSTGSTFTVVAVPFDEDARLEWSPLHSLTGGPTRWLPTMQLYYFYPKHARTLYAWADSNGCAAGTTPEDALLQGLMELFERDAVAIWWYNRLRRPAVDLASSDDPFVARCVDAYRAVGRELWVLDVTSDLGVPAFTAVSRRVDKPVEDILLAFGAHLDPAIALRRAVSELNQFLPAVLDVGPDGGGYRFPDPVQMHWWRTARLADHPYLAPDPDAAPVRLDAFPRQSGSDIAVDLRHAVDLCTKAGLDAYGIDMTRPDIGLPVFKAVVPGLRHFWARFGPGRLYDVPVRMGWLDAPLPEQQLNPVPMFL
ncbi:hypothetical protein RVR_1250 [Actinacidiphila reveromycinica]|uniref:YcaO domain-containing protein n=1 Tax=Actinacidiphila reveromycinica TaxID=659352 RepID=A0A7U3UP24_9ACTN|nr:TOMM precursor leader peptide-binding protein [Streptomyces sp. SN-593]BBA96101.1 hypothetical protein RVR_1250 [Streptomyces sp. SN-593]